MSKRYPPLIILLTSTLFLSPIQLNALQAEGGKNQVREYNKIGSTSKIEVQTNVETQKSKKSYRFSGLLLGIAGGIATGFLIADLTDFPLKEGGGYGVILWGGSIGGFIGYKIGASLEKQKLRQNHMEGLVASPKKIQISLGYAWTASKASNDIMKAFKASEFSARNEHHSIAPNLTLIYRMSNRFNIGLELSGISAQSFRSRDAEVFLSEHVNGNSYGLMMNYKPLALDKYPFVYAIGTGVDYYSINVESYFDPADGNYSINDSSRWFRGTQNRLGLQFRANLDYYFVQDVSIQLKLIGRWVKPVEIRQISFTHPSTNHRKQLVNHSVNLSSLHLLFSIGMHF